MVNLAFVRRNSTTGQNKLSEAIPMVYLITHGITYLRSKLPFINQVRSVSHKKPAHVHFCKLQIYRLTLRIIHIDNTLGYLFGRRSFTTPFGPLNQDGTLAIKFSLKQCISYSLLIFHSHPLYKLHCKDTQFINHFHVWRIITSIFDAFSLPCLACLPLISAPRKCWGGSNKRLNATFGFSLLRHRTTV